MNNNCKIIALYLPQFHETKENNEWWGKGFTEWTHVKKAIPYFANHIQPKKTLLGFYDLLNSDTMLSQTSLMKKYGLYGFAYYHYWFEGRLLLDKPIEKLMNDKSIDQHYMFIWANHDWYKTIGRKSTLLIRQTYGGQDDWDKHYNYLVQHFLDSRYIKIDNQPVICIYEPLNISNLDEMITWWNKRAQNDGFNGIYVICSCNHLNDISQMSRDKYHYVIRQPNIAFDCIRKHDPIIVKALRYLNKRITKFPHIKKYKYSDVIRYEKEICTKYSENALFSVCTGWDNTPRHGKRGSLISNFNPNDFKKSFEAVYTASLKNDNEFIFINAWNEWAEGMYLEPDEIYEYKLLESILDVKENVMGE